MRTLSFIVVLLAAAFACSAQTIYSVGVYSMGQDSEHNWSIGHGSTRFGFDSYRQYQDANGRDLHTFSDVITKGFAARRYTTVFFGPVHLTLSGSASFAALLFAIVLASLFLLITVVIGSPRKCQSYAHITPPLTNS